MELPDMVTPRLNTSTALGQALILMFKSVEAELKYTTQALVRYTKIIGLEAFPLRRSRLSPLCTFTLLPLLI